MQMFPICLPLPNPTSKTQKCGFLMTPGVLKKITDLKRIDLIFLDFIMNNFNGKASVMHQSKNTGPIRRIYSEAIVKAKTQQTKNCSKSGIETIEKV